MKDDLRVGFPVLFPNETDLSLVSASSHTHLTSSQSQKRSFSGFSKCQQLEALASTPRLFLSLLLFLLSLLLP
jgi:hypothetical protein